MNIEETKEAIRVMQSWLDGKDVECQYHGSETRRNAPIPSWNWFDCTYRIKPAPASARGLRMRFRWGRG